MKRYFTKPSFWGLSALIAVAMTAPAIAQGATASDQPQGGASTTAQRQLVSRLQRSAGDEINRRLAMLNEIKDDLAHSKTLPEPVIRQIGEEVEAQILVHVAFNKAIGSYSDLPSVQRDVAKLEAEYPRYVMTARKGFLIVTADFQTHLANKTEAVAAKLQRRLTVANNDGKDVSTVQIALNDLRTNLTEAQGLTAEVVNDVPRVALGTYETNKAWMALKLSRLQTANKDLNNSHRAMQTVTQAIESQDL